MITMDQSVQWNHRDAKPLPALPLSLLVLFLPSLDCLALLLPVDAAAAANGHPEERLPLNPPIYHTQRSIFLSLVCDDAAILLLKTKGRGFSQQLKHGGDAIVVR
ncbi:hypothetical protein IWX49DRAFT_325652 [Phyllosticta citricarpa]